MIGKAFELISVFICDRVSADTRDFKQLDRVIAVQILAPIGHCAVFTSGTTIIVGCTGLRHNAKVIGIWAFTASLSRPECRTRICSNRFVLSGNIRTPLGCDGSGALIIPVAIVIFECQCFFCSIVIDIDNSGTIRRNGDGVRLNKLPQIII